MSRVLHLFLVLLLGTSSWGLRAQTHEVPAELWDRPRTSTAILGQESVKRAVAALLAQPDAQLVIHHAAAQEVVLQAEELRSWLGALAIDTRRVTLRADLPGGMPIRVEVIQ